MNFLEQRGKKKKYENYLTMLTLTSSWLQCHIQVSAVLHSSSAACGPWVWEGWEGVGAADKTIGKAF